MSEQVYTIMGRSLGLDGRSVDWVERTISFAENNHDWCCLCTFPNNDSAAPEGITPSRVRSLALLGAAVVLLHNGEYMSHSGRLPDCVPEYIREAIMKAIPEEKKEETIPLIENCPYCQQQNTELVEAWSENFQEMGSAVECLDCGLRSMIAQKGDDRIAIEAWNSMAKAIIAAGVD